MLVVVSYDVATTTLEGRRRLRRVAKCCLDYGQRVQNSVFECLVDNEHWTKLRIRLLDLIDVETDSLRFYRLGNRYRSRVEHHGAKPTTDLEGPLVI